MRLTNITLQNFKCFGQKQSIDLGRLTILTGANSSGKSSLMYGILGAIQSGEFPLQFSTNGKYVNMGDFRDISFQRKPKREITLAFTFENVKQSQLDNFQVETVWVEDTRNRLPRLFEIVMKSDFFDIVLRKKQKKYSLDFTYKPEKHPFYNQMGAAQFKKITEAIFSSIPNIAEAVEAIQPNKKNSPSNFNSEKIVGQILKVFATPLAIQQLEVPSLDIIRELKLSSHEAASAWIQSSTRDIVNSFNAFDQTINFIGSSRLHPERTYLEVTKNDLKVEKFGENYLDQIIAWETKNTPQFKKLMNLMLELGLLTGIKSNRMDGGRFEVAVQSKKGGVFTSLADVGFGISQFLPILVADLQLPNDSTLFVAQPEIHLHPDIQSRFGEFLIKQVRDTEKNYVIETHSEYCLNRLRLGIVKGEIAASDVKIYYLNDSHENPYDTTVHTIEFTKSGQILGAPPDFFTTYQMDVMEIALHAE